MHRGGGWPPGSEAAAGGGGARVHVQRARPIDTAGALSRTHIIAKAQRLLSPAAAACMQPACGASGAAATMQPARRPARDACVCAFHEAHPCDPPAN
jgi:hypothetical protein